MERITLHSTDDTRAPSSDQSLAELIGAMPEWVPIVAGGLVSAILGLLLGGALHI